MAAKKKRADGKTLAEIRRECAAERKLIALYKRAKTIANKANLDEQIAKLKKQSADECKAVKDGAAISTLKGRYRVARALGLGVGSVGEPKKKAAKKKAAKKKAAKKRAAPKKKAAKRTPIRRAPKKTATKKKAAKKRAAPKKKAAKKKAAKRRTGPARK